MRAPAAAHHFLADLHVMASDGLQDSAGRMMQPSDATWEIAPLAFCQPCFFFLCLKARRETPGLHQAASLKAVFFYFSGCQREREREKGGGGCSYCSFWNNGSCGATCSGAHMNGPSSGMSVCVWGGWGWGRWGVTIPKPLSQRLTMNPHRLGLPEVTGQPLFCPALQNT